MGTAAMLHGGLDLHGDNVFCSLLDGNRQVVFERRLPNELELIKQALEPYKSRIQALAVESTYNWYWLVDGLRRLRYPVKLANPAKMQENLGLKMANDKTDARFIARQLINGILPEGYIYPEEMRGIRDMLRRRLRLVQAKSGEWVSLESLVARHTGRSMNVKELEACDLEEVLVGQPQALVMAQANLRHIRFLADEVKALEKEAMSQLPDKEGYKRLMTVPGIGPVLARTILLETGPIDRFKEAGNYASYCRTVSATHTSNSKKKAEGNQKAGNKYLAWAYVEAATLSARYSPEIQRWFQRKMARGSLRVVATKALASKLAKACFFMMRDKTEFDVKRLVGGE